MGCSIAPFGLYIDYKALDDVWGVTKTWCALSCVFWCCVSIGNFQNLELPSWIVSVQHLSGTLLIAWEFWLNSTEGAAFIHFLFLLLQAGP